MVGGCEGTKKLRLAYRLDEMYIKAGLRRPLAVLLLSPAGQRDQRDILGPSMQSYLSRRLLPVHPRHTQVKQYDVRLKRLCDFKRL